MFSYWINENSSKVHKEGCRFLKRPGNFRDLGRHGSYRDAKSSDGLAIQLGATPCKICNRGGA